MGVPFALRSCAAGDAATQVSSRKEIPKVLFFLSEMGWFCQDKLGSGLRFCRPSLPLLPQTPLPPNLRMVVTEYNVMERAGPLKL